MGSARPATRPRDDERSDVTVRELLDRYRDGVTAQKGAAWFDRNGTRFDLALQPLLDAHGDDPAAEFSRGSEAREPVAEDVVFATLPHLHPVNAALVEVLLWTAARPHELFNLCPQDIEKREPAWYAEPEKHKTARFGKVRIVGLGPHAQAILRPFLDRVPRPAETKPMRIREARNEEDAALIAGHARKSMTDHYTIDAIRERVLAIAAEVA